MAEKDRHRRRRRIRQARRLASVCKGKQFAQGRIQFEVPPWRPLIVNSWNYRHV